MRVSQNCRSDWKKRRTKCRARQAGTVRSWVNYVHSWVPATSSLRSWLRSLQTAEQDHRLLARFVLLERAKLQPKRLPRLSPSHTLDQAQGLPAKDQQPHRHGEMHDGKKAGIAQLRAVTVLLCVGTLQASGK